MSVGSRLKAISERLVRSRQSTLLEDEHLLIEGVAQRERMLLGERVRLMVTDKRIRYRTVLHFTNPTLYLWHDIWPHEIRNFGVKRARFCRFLPIHGFKLRLTSQKSVWFLGLFNIDDWEHALEQLTGGKSTEQ